MSYQVLARKWRPKSFHALMGQEHVVAVLTNALTQQRLHHAYLFTGTRGVGKTTIARIFAKSLNCEQGISAEPCGQCSTCVDIDEGRFVDLLEVDAASRTKVDDTREILDNVQYAPSRGRYKVYLIDEVHMLSRSSFNALLKTLEEPPEHVKFILATTDPQKLPITVLSRCLQFHLKALTQQQIKQQLDTILSQEGVTFDSPSLALLAKAAKGSMRDCLSLTDQAIAQGQGHLSVENIQQMLGGVDQNWSFKIVIALIKQDTLALMSLSQEIAEYAPNYQQLFADLLQLFHHIAIAQTVEHHFDLLPDQNLLLEKFSDALAQETIQLYYQIVLNGRKDMPYTGDEQAAFDMTLLRLAAFRPMQHHDLSQSVSSIENEPVKLEFNEASLETQLVKVKQAVSEQPAEIEEASLETMEQELNDEMASIEQLAQSTVGNENVFAEKDISSEITVPSPAANNIETVSDAKESLNATSLQDSTDVQEEPVVQHPVEHAIASRNMLRSRKKALEQQTKKPEGASAPKSNELETNIKESALKQNQPASKPVPAPETLPEQYISESIDPAIVRSANQVDKWANMIDAMALNGRIRQLAIHATISPNSTDDILMLELDQSTKHLQSDNAHQQLEQAISQYLQRTISVDIKVVEQTIADPYQIQSDINDKRYQYAKQLLETDDVVAYFQQQFQAELDADSIKAL